jgi:hypothetical protein
MLVDAERLDTTRTTIAMGAEATSTRISGAHEARSASRPNHWWNTASAMSADTL